MRLRVLGSAAGGGFPQWNCGCDLCRAARAGSGQVRARSQSSLCASADGVRWVLFNASPDVRSQVLAFSALAPRGVRGSGIAAVALTNADIDHAAGLLVLREGGAPPVYCTARVQAALTEGLRILPVLAAYGPVTVRTVEPDRRVELADGAGAALGMSLTPFAVASKAPPYMAGRLPPDDLAGDTVGYVIAAEGREVVYVPGVRDLDDALRARLARAECVLIDGTFSTDDELLALGASHKTARAMGHAPLAGPGGIVEFLATVPCPRKVLVHVNNSNPVLWERGEARAELARAGIEVAHDGLEIEV